MPSGAISLIEAAKASSDQLKRGVIETIIEEAPMLGELSWVPFEGTALRHFEEGTLPNVQFREVNEGYTASWGSDNDHYWGVAILGGEVKVDNFLVNVVDTRSGLEAKQWAKLAKANSLRFSWETFKGTGAVSTKGFKGLNTLIDEGFGQKLLQATGGGTLTLAKADEAIDLFRNQGGPQVGWLNRTVRRKFTDLARTTHSGISLIDVGTDIYGKKVTMYDGVPFRIIGDGMDSAGAVNPILAFNEDPGDATADCTSIYWAKTGEDDVTGLLGKGGSFEVKQFGELEAGPQRLGRMEWYPGIAIFNRYSIVRQFGITNT
jgi:hypothetical protein